MTIEPWPWLKTSLFGTEVYNSLPTWTWSNPAWICPRCSTVWGPGIIRCTCREVVTTTSSTTMTTMPKANDNWEHAASQVGKRHKKGKKR